MHLFSRDAGIHCNYFKDPQIKDRLYNHIIIVYRGRLPWSSDASPSEVKLLKKYKQNLRNMEVVVNMQFSLCVVPFILKV